MGCHLGWYFAVGCPLRGGRGKYIQKGTSVPQKTTKEEKKYYPQKTAKFKIKKFSANILLCINKIVNSANPFSAPQQLNGK
jgi:hypothetical protein